MDQESAAKIAALKANGIASLFEERDRMIDQLSGEFHPSAVEASALETEIVGRIGRKFQKIDDYEAHVEAEKVRLNEEKES